MTEWIAAVAAVAAVAVAVFAWRAADRSAVAAEGVTRIERDRWHRELTPDLDLRLTQHHANYWTLNLELAGPENLEALDSLTLEVLDEKGVNHLPNPAAGITEDELRTVIWGPLRLRPGVDGITGPGRTTTIDGLELGQRAVRAMELSLQPNWYNDPIDTWARHYLDHPLRLRIVCNKADHRWILIRELPVPQN
ncbi:hypothetical protein ACFW9N_19055 [Streptomyces sp. NPDC059496]|uniref:hypothetical protein n=1 Tax=Streptomyces sp. NPDC059496 TaxID=3346851 RepID=UPI0036A7A6E5